MPPLKISNKQIKCNTKKQTSNPKSSSRTPYISMMLVVRQVLFSAPDIYTSLNPLNCTKSTLPMTQRRKLSTAGVTSPKVTYNKIRASARVWTQAAGLKIADGITMIHKTCCFLFKEYVLRIVGHTLICFSLIVGMEPPFLISTGSIWRGHLATVNLKVENTVSKILSY